MKTLSLQTTIAADGSIDLHLPCDLPPGPVSVTVSIQSAPSPFCSDPPASLGDAAGSWAGLANPRASREATEPFHPVPPTRSRSGLFVNRVPHEIDIDAALEEMNLLWKAKLLDLHHG